MGNLHLVTGYGGTEHITAEDHGAFNAATFGSGNYVLNLGNQFKATVVSNNLIRIADGELMTQGRHIRLKSGTYVDLTIENGAQGYNRTDLIVARYNKDTATGLEDCNLIVIKGAATTGTASTPTYKTGNLISGAASIHDVPLYSVPITGIAVGTPVRITAVANRTLDHNHDSLYYTQAATDELLAKKLSTTNVADYVTEQGSTSGWKWRKWKSGRKECWKSGEFTTSINVNAGGFYHSTTYGYIMPFAFDTIESWSISGNGSSSSFNIILRLMNFGDTQDRCNIQAVSLNGDESQAVVQYSIHVMGT